jgi:hypothetical protein
MDTSTGKPPYNATATERTFSVAGRFRLIHVSGYSQIPFKTSLYAELNVKIRSGMKSADIRIAVFYVKMPCAAAG